MSGWLLVLAGIGAACGNSKKTPPSSNAHTTSTGMSDSGVSATRAKPDSGSPGSTKPSEADSDASATMVPATASDMDSGTDSTDATTIDAAPSRVSVPKPAPSGCVTDVSPGKRQVDCDGLTHDITVPEACIDTQCGLILDVHGGTMNAKMEDNNTNLSMLGSAHGYVVVQPNAANGLFDATTDDTKVLAFAQTMITVFHLDPKRVHMTGFSQGGYMTWRFICQHTDFLASAAPAAASGAANISDETDCSFTGSDVPKSELDVLYMHGTKDALVDFQNGVTKREAVIAAFSLGPGAPVSGDNTYRHTRYTNAKGTIFEFIDHDYISNSSFPADPPLGIAIQGHCYPGSKDLTPTEPGQLMAFGCQPPTSFTWGETVLAFFMAHEGR